MMCNTMTKFACTLLLALIVHSQAKKDTIDFLCLTCEEDLTKSIYTQCCTNGLGLDYCCSAGEKGGNAADAVGKAVGGLFSDITGGKSGTCASNDDCNQDTQQFCCWGGRCCEVSDYLDEGLEAFFRSFGGYIIGSILLALILLLILGLFISICCCICKK
ncbi:uncharacterized protein LOC142354765 [Convolutriloba macropyga]|uniref:uncharacterized protein LOC142354765 n=1 Tax=Convolutriloba macropyga TaxID=536237 RepID=UPI003F520051